MKQKIVHPLRKVFTLAILLLLSVNTLTAQGEDVKYLSLSEAISLGLEHNREIKLAQYNNLESRGQYQQTSAVFLPNISVQYNAISTNDPLNVFGFKLKQTAVTMQDFDPVNLNDPGAYENFSTVLEIQQPLFNADLIQQRRAVQQLVRSTQEQVNATKLQKIFEIQDIYYKLQLSIKQKEVLEKALLTAQEHHRQAIRFFEEGMISKADKLAANVFQLGITSEILRIENEYQDLQQQLAHILGVDINSKIIPADELIKVEYNTPDTNLQMSVVDNAMIRSVRYQVEAADKMLQASQFSYLPRVNLFGSLELNDSNAFGFGNQHYMIGANLSWTIFSGFQQSGKVMQAKANKKTAETMLENVTLQMSTKVAHASRMLELAILQIEIAEQTIEQAQENTRIRSNRFSEGMENTTDLLRAETGLLEARMQYFMAIYAHNISVAAIDMITETNF